MTNLCQYKKTNDCIYVTRAFIFPITLICFVKLLFNSSHLLIQYTTHIRKKCSKKQRWPILLCVTFYHTHQSEHRSLHLLVYESHTVLTCIQSYTTTVALSMWDSWLQTIRKPIYTHLLISSMLTYHCRLNENGCISTIV